MNTTYSFLDVTAALVGPGGFANLGAGSGAAEEGISIDSSVDLNTMTIGADGSGMHSLSANRSGTITLRLLKTSPVNAVLMAMMNFQTSSAATHGQNTLTLVDKNRGDAITCQQVAFVKAPPLSYGNEAGMNEWGFQAIRIDRALGGLV